ncbi:hypothetical protein ACM25N_16000 [Roseovarius sp. C7]|uniref:hypothetical protein n=1 Tax=Roseovarius sp. C7 TaxID=3398643 RepID=UPI0039F653E9
MPKFLLAYHGGGAPSPDDETEIARVMAAWQGWFEGMGATCLDMGNPVGMSKTVTRDGLRDDGGANPVSGYSLIEAVDIETACEIARGCPILEDGAGTVEIAPIMEM